MITREQLERIANNCGVKVSYSKPGDGGFIIDSSGIKYKSMTDEFMSNFDHTNDLQNGYNVNDESINYAA